MSKLLIAVGGYILSKFALKLLTALGIGFVTFKAISTLTETLLDSVAPLLNGLPSVVLNLLALSGVPEALSVMASALLTAAAINSAKAFIGAVK